MIKRFFPKANPDQPVEQIDWFAVPGFADGSSTTIDLTVCSRCGGRHNALMFRPLTIHSRVAQGNITHWSFCPTMMEPIIILTKGRP